MQASLAIDLKDLKESGLVELRNALDGDRVAWQRFYTRFQPLIASCVAHVLKSRNVPFNQDDLDDFVSEVWLSLLRRDAVGLRRYDPTRGRSLPSWIRLLAVRCTIDQLRGRTMQQRMRESEGDLERLSDETSRPDSRVERKQRLEVARQALAQLKERDQHFMELCLEDAEPAQMARELGIAVATVHSRRFKLGQKLGRLVRRQRRQAQLRRSACHKRSIH
jgi:RNA polymerase sigma factor (sigma-70 family)